mmetsp:Transcript_7120/g.9483  ORF Transcript_7120/g.9483 Transcript_7120/m.9483 type:complete len:166 (-) Transcript_7120:1473-1970(-)
MRRVLEEECENKNETATALEKERTTKGFIQRLKEVDLLYLDAEYKDKRSARNKKKKVAMRNGGTESKGVKKEKFNPQNGGEDRNDIDGGKHHDRYNSTSIFVSNLAYKTSVEDLKNHMCAAGNVNQVSFVHVVTQYILFSMWVRPCIDLVSLLHIATCPFSHNEP